MTAHFQIYMAGLSDTGLSCEHNEDYIAWDEEHGLAVLADGMGGHRAGDVASRLCVETLKEALVSAEHKPASVKQAIEQANQAVFTAAEENPDYKGMGTTLVLALFHSDKVVVAHVGDSRLYRLRGGELKALTADHSLVRELLEQGVIGQDEAHDNPYSHIITQAVGVRPEVTPEVQELDAAPGDIYLLCSDGLTDMLRDNDIHESLMATQGNWPRSAQRLVDLANQRGGHDNISVVIAALGAPR